MKTSNTALPLGDSKQGRDFEKLVVWVSTASIAVMAGFLASIKQVNPAVQFRFSALSVVAFILGGVATTVFLRIVLRSDNRSRAVFVFGAAIACVLGYFLMGLRNAARENRGDMTIGTIIAVAVLSFVAWLLWRVSRFLERDEVRNRNNAGKL